jgi:hypothetical protein
MQHHPGITKPASNDPLLSDSLNWEGDFTFFFFLAKPYKFTTETKMLVNHDDVIHVCMSFMPSWIPELKCFSTFSEGAYNSVGSIFLESV